MKGLGAAIALCAAWLGTAPLALADGDPRAGREKSQPCHACHGETGHSPDPMYPVLAGQYESYLVKALEDYRAGRRGNPVMAGFATSLSDRDIADLAAWYAAQEGLKDLSRAHAP